MGFIIIVSTLLSCWSSTGDIEYELADESPAGKRLDLTTDIAILDFTDKRFSVKRFRSRRKSNLIGVFFGGYKNPIRKIYSNQPITRDVMDAIENLFKANGFRVTKYEKFSDLSDPFEERLVVKGLINEFFLKSYPGLRSASLRLEAHVDIDLVIFDKKYQRNIWAGKIVDVQEMPKHKGIFTSTDRIFSFLNTVFSKGISEAWVNRGMLKALESLNKKAPSSLSDLNPELSI